MFCAELQKINIIRFKNDPFLFFNKKKNAKTVLLDNFLGNFFLALIILQKLSFLCPELDFEKITNFFDQFLKIPKIDLLT